ncbi:MAG: DUF1772 domain-containing protein [Cellulophaga sp.]
MKTETIILVLATLSTGVMAGIFFTWTNAVTPGIGTLSDMGYLRALQSMNKAILNTSFRIVFITSIITVVLAPLFYYKAFPNYLFWILTAVFIIHWVGVFGVTLLGNIPLNRMLDNTNLETISVENAKILRNTIETKWNNLNLIRTVSSTISFLILLISVLLIKK